MSGRWEQDAGGACLLFTTWPDTVPSRNQSDTDPQAIIAIPALRRGNAAAQRPGGLPQHYIVPTITFLNSKLVRGGDWGGWWGGGGPTAWSLRILRVVCAENLRANGINTPRMGRPGRPSGSKPGLGGGKAPGSSAFDSLGNERAFPEYPRCETRSGETRSRRVLRIVGWGDRKQGMCAFVFRGPLPLARLKTARRSVVHGKVGVGRRRVWSWSRPGHEIRRFDSVRNDRHHHVLSRRHPGGPCGTAADRFFRYGGLSETSPIMAGLFQVVTLAAKAPSAIPTGYHLSKDTWREIPPTPESSTALRGRAGRCDRCPAGTETRRLGGRGRRARGSPGRVGWGGWGGGGGGGGGGCPYRYG